MNIVETSGLGKRYGSTWALQTHLLARATADDPVPPGWEAHPVDLEELAMAYLREHGASALPGPARSRNTQPSEVTR
jgi:hypothetical protein